ncbi:MAG: MFS transporter [Nitrospiria bacterium]
MPTGKSRLKSKLYWIAILYFSEGFPLGIFYDLFPVHFRQQGVALWKIGLMSLLGLSWTLKFLWAPLIDHFRHHRRWMFSVDLLMAVVMILFAIGTGYGAWVWMTIGVFTFLSATNDIAIDGYTIEFLKKGELGLANGFRIGFYRVGMLASGFILIMSDYIEWSGAYLLAGGLLCGCGLLCLRAPREKVLNRAQGISLLEELKRLFQNPASLTMVLLFSLGVLWLINNATKWSTKTPYFWWTAFGFSGFLFIISVRIASKKRVFEKEKISLKMTEGPMFGTMMAMVKRPCFIPVVFFILTFKLADSAMGFMVKPFWVDSGFSASEIGLVSVNLGLALSILGGMAGGWITDRAGIFKSLWVLGLFQAVSNLGYALAAWVISNQAEGNIIPITHKAMLYSASAIESFTGGLGTAAFLAFLMAIVAKKNSATEYALLSSIFALSRSLAGWAGGLGAEMLGYAPYFLFTFFLAFPAYFLLPWVDKVLKNTLVQASS